MKERIIAILLALCLGWGLHWFYLNNNKKGMSYVITTIIGILTTPLLIGLIPLIVVGIMNLIDAIKFCIMTDDEFNNLYN